MAAISLELLFTPVDTEYKDEIGIFVNSLSGIDIDLENMFKHSSSILVTRASETRNSESKIIAILPVSESHIDDLEENLILSPKFRPCRGQIIAVIEKKAMEMRELSKLIPKGKI